MRQHKMEVKISWYDVQYLSWLKHHSIDLNTIQSSDCETHWHNYSYSTPCANIITKPGDTIIASPICSFSEAIITIACFPGTLLVTYCSYLLRFICLVSSVLSPVGHLRSWALAISSVRRCEGHPLSPSARLMMACRTASGVEIIPPHLLTRADLRVDSHRTVWIAFSVSSVLLRLPQTEVRMLRTISLRIRISRYWSFSCSSRLSTLLTSSSTRSDFSLRSLCSSWTQLCLGTSSNGTTKPHPLSQGTGLLGLKRHSLWCAPRESNLTTVVHPKSLLSHDIFNRESKFLNIRGGWIKSSTGDTGFRSTGHTCWCLNHSWTQEPQKQCSHWRIWTGDSRTWPHIVHINSSSTSSLNLVIS